jgi:hypothetical protein
VEGGRYYRQRVLRDLVGGLGVWRIRPRYWQPSLAGEVSDLASQPSILGAVGRARDRLGRQQYGGCIKHSRFMPRNYCNEKSIRWLTVRAMIVDDSEGL